jgi:hypothetical protein
VSGRARRHRLPGRGMHRRSRTSRGACASEGPSSAAEAREPASGSRPRGPLRPAISASRTGKAGGARCRPGWRGRVRTRGRQGVATVSRRAPRRRPRRRPCLPDRGRGRRVRRAGRDSSGIGASGSRLGLVALPGRRARGTGLVDPDPSTGRTPEVDLPRKDRPRRVEDLRDLASRRSKTCGKMAVGVVWEPRAPARRKRQRRG